MYSDYLPVDCSDIDRLDDIVFVRAPDAVVAGRGQGAASGIYAGREDGWVPLLLPPALDVEGPGPLGLVLLVVVFEPVDGVGACVRDDFAVLKLEGSPGRFPVKDLCSREGLFLGHFFRHVACRYSECQVL